MGEQTVAGLTHVEAEPVVITPRLAMAYSAGLLLADARFYGADGQSPPALPFLCTRLEWPATLAFRNVLGLKPRDLAKGVHARQDTEFHRPFKIGETVRVVGDLVETRGTRAGALTITRFQTQSLTHGDVVATSWSSGIYRGVPLPGQPFCTVESPAAIELDQDDRRAEADVHFPRHITHVYSECADIWNPIHTEEPVARAAGLPSIIVHGTILWALAGVGLIDLAAAGDFNRLKRFSGRFQAPVLPDSTARLVVQGGGQALGWRLEDPKTGVVHVAGEALIA